MHVARLNQCMDAQIVFGATGLQRNRTQVVGIHHANRQIFKGAINSTNDRLFNQWRVGWQDLNRPLTNHHIFILDAPAQRLQAVIKRSQLRKG